MNKQEHNFNVSSDHNKNKVVLIGCICGAVVLAVAVSAQLVLHALKYKEDEVRAEETVISNQEEGALEEKEEEPTAAEPNKETDPMTEALNYSSDEVNFDLVCYEPEFHPYDFLGEREMRELNNSTADAVLDDDYSMTGTLYSVSEDLYMDTTVYYHPETKGIEMIWTIQDEGDYLHTCMYTFRGGRILEVIDMVINDYDMDEVKRDDSFLYAENCMVMMMLTDEENEEGYIREMYELLNEEKQALYLEKEAEYLNRAYILYDAVSEW